MAKYHVLGIGYDYDYYSLATAKWTNYDIEFDFADSFAQAKALLSINVKCFGEDYVQKVNKAVVNMFIVHLAVAVVGCAPIVRCCTVYVCEMLCDFCVTK